MNYSTSDYDVFTMSNTITICDGSTRSRRAAVR